MKAKAANVSFICPFSGTICSRICQLSGSLGPVSNMSVWIVTCDLHELMFVGHLGAAQQAASTTLC